MRKRGKKRKKRSRIGSSADYCEYRKEWWGGQEQREKRKVRRGNWTKKFRERLKNRLVRGEEIEEEWRDVRDKIKWRWREWKTKKG